MTPIPDVYPKLRGEINVLKFPFQTTLPQATW